MVDRGYYWNKFSLQWARRTAQSYVGTPTRPRREMGSP
ncbi:hypothetical protein GA0115254_1173209 [Streptomyces sp. Ncost-T10-10d]|nr:hypothetical protein GA0115254_1173209 [Streptomyces sp. Ncost-T10-10d]